MLLNCILLALSVSIDSLGIGISYGIKHTKISKTSNFTLFSISFIVTSLSIIIGNTISSILSEKFSVLLGSAFLMLLGFYGIYKNISNKTTNYDFNNSNESANLFFPIISIFFLHFSTSSFNIINA